MPDREKIKELLDRIAKYQASDDVTDRHFILASANSAVMLLTECQDKLAFLLAQLETAEVEAKTFISREAARQLIADILPYVERDPYQPPGIVVRQVCASEVFDAIRNACDPPMSGEEFNRIADEIDGSRPREAE